MNQCMLKQFQIKTDIDTYKLKKKQTICVDYQQTLSPGLFSKTNDLLTKMKTERFKLTVGIRQAKGRSRLNAARHCRVTLSASGAHIPKV